MKAGRLRQSLISLAGLAIVFGGLVSVDPRVRDHFATLFSGTDGGTLGQRVAELGEILLSAVRTQSIENAPLVVFATVGAILFVFMVRT